MGAPSTRVEHVGLPPGRWLLYPRSLRGSFRFSYIIHWRSLKLFSYVQAPDDELVDLQFVDSGATDGQSTDGQRADGYCADREGAHRQSANCLG